MMRMSLAAILLVLSLAACRGSRERLTDSGYDIANYEPIFIDVHNSEFVFDWKANRREYAEGAYYFVSPDSVVLDARFDPFAIPYAVYHNASTPVHINVPQYLDGDMPLQERSTIRCPTPGRCRVVLYALPDLYPHARHDSLSTELFDVVGDETILTRVGYNDWYRISIQDTVRVLRTIQTWEFGAP